MTAGEIKQAILELPEPERRDLVKELSPEFIRQMRQDSVLRDECLTMLREKTVSQSQQIISAATEKLAGTGQAIRRKLDTARGLG